MIQNISYIIISDGVYKDNEDNLIIHKPLNHIEVNELPTRTSFELTIGLINLRRETIYDIDVTIFEPGGHRIVSEGYSIQMSDKIKTDIGYVTINTKIHDISLPSDGTYKIFVSMSPTGDEKIMCFTVCQGSGTK
ncbi:DUF6941 family protein [Aeribacillus composti]|uniref:Uncharacterized protein n=1 Tax=Anoxybacillus phage A403 TaxID=2099336 RepID=A0A2P1JU14_9CAUD|nr:hypothetical protein HWB56_gp55 [Anoxybacillus phage A403]AVO22623.1 hypothetical protein [Anoxybacillus phage A403]